MLTSLLEKALREKDREFADWLQNWRKKLDARELDEKIKELKKR